MIKHIVFWKFAEKNKRETIEKVRGMLLALPDAVREIRSLEVGVNFHPKGYDLCLCTAFDSKEALNAYQVHPDHVAVKEFIATVQTDSAVCDYEI